jgi:hypothetical protein
MRKIPTVFRRDPDDMKRVLPEVTPGCEWVLDGEGAPTRKYDGTCVMLDNAGEWWARREVKPGKREPEGFVVAETDPNTGKTVGWEPIAQSPFAKFHVEAIVNLHPSDLAPGTYELCGPKIQKDPEGFGSHRLVPHDCAEVLDDAPRDFEGLALYLGIHDFEGIVWHHEDGRMAKLKRRDLCA